MKFEFDNKIPIYIQLVEQLKNHIISGNLKPGERLPWVRDLAMQTKVNPNTMQKALVELEELSLIYTERTNGKYVTTDTSLINKYKEEHGKQEIETSVWAWNKGVGAQGGYRTLPRCNPYNW